MSWIVGLLKFIIGDRNLLDHGIKPLINKTRQRRQAKELQEEAKPKRSKAKTAIILSTITAIIGLSFVIVYAMARVTPLSSDTLLKYYADAPNSANDNISISDVSESSDINHGFCLEVKITPESSWEDYKNCYYDIYIAPGDARPGGENNFNFATGGVMGFKGILEVEKRAYVIQPSYTGAPISYDQYDPSKPQDTDVGFAGSATTSHAYAIQYEFDLEDIPTAQYSDNQRFYTIAIAVYAPDNTTHIGRSDLYTIEYETATDKKSAIKMVHVVALTGKTPVIKIIYYIAIAITGTSLLVFVGALAFGIKRKKKLESS